MDGQTLHLERSLDGYFSGQALRAKKIKALILFLVIISFQDHWSGFQYLKASV